MKFGHAWTFVNKHHGETPAPPAGRASPGITAPPAYLRDWAASSQPSVSACRGGFKI